MGKRFLLLAALIALFLAISFGLNLAYGPSYPFLAGEDCWQPDGQGDWLAHGQPTNPAPSVPSVEIPLLLHYLPIFVPALVLILFVFTPLRRHLDPPPAAASETDESVASDE